MNVEAVHIQLALKRWKIQNSFLKRDRDIWSKRGKSLNSSSEMWQPPSLYFSLSLLPLLLSFFFRSLFLSFVFIPCLSLNLSPNKLIEVLNKKNHLYLSDCYRKEQTGYKHYFTMVRDSVTASSAAACSAECHSRYLFNKSVSFFSTR